MNVWSLLREPPELRPLGDVVSEPYIWNCGGYSHFFSKPTRIVGDVEDCFSLFGVGVTSRLGFVGVRDVEGLRYWGGRSRLMVPFCDGCDSMWCYGWSPVLSYPDVDTTVGMKVIRGLVNETYFSLVAACANSQ